MGLFDLGSLKKEPSDQTDGSLILKERFLQEHFYKVETIKQLVGTLPLEGEIFCIWTLNSFNAFTFIPFMIKQQGKLEELIISTYSISSRILHSIINYLDKGRILKIHITISDSIKFRMPKVYEQLEVLCRRPEFSASYTWNHSKVTLMKTSEGHFIVEGSGNFSENAQYEQYMFVQSERIYNFRKSCIQTS